MTSSQRTPGLKPARQIRGTYEWAAATVNCSRGCSHNCCYCYARQKFIETFGEQSDEAWEHVQPLNHQRDDSRRRFAGTVMFPSLHDIVPENLEDCLQTISSLLSHGNKLLIVSKPHHACIQTLCRELLGFSRQILFRFTITARRDEVLALWEPGAPRYDERLICLKLAKNLGFETSVSIEPILDMEDVVKMVHELLPHVTQTIWLGKMNRISERVRTDSVEMTAAVAEIEQNQTDDRIIQLYHKLSNLPAIRWKESIKEVIGLARPSEAGLDI